MSASGRNQPLTRLYTQWLLMTQSSRSQKTPSRLSWRLPELKSAHSQQIHTGVKVAAAYLVIAGVLGIVIPVLFLGDQYPEFNFQSLSYKAGAFLREGIQSIAFIVCGAGLILGKSWARMWALVVLAYSTIYLANQFAWGYTGGPPATNIRLLSFAIFITWNGIWFLLIYRYANRNGPNSATD
jgi:hypothetical protein